MTDPQKLHEEILSWARKEYSIILKDSKQAIYLYICDRHRLCNKQFSSLLGYDSTEEWEKKDEMMSDVKEEDQQIIISAYRNAMENKIGSSITISWKNKSKGNFVKTNVILVPLSYKDELFALHFITKI